MHSIFIKGGPIPVFRIIPIRLSTIFTDIWHRRYYLTETPGLKESKSRKVLDESQGSIVNKWRIDKQVKPRIFCSKGFHFIDTKLSVNTDWKNHATVSYK